MSLTRAAAVVFPRALTLSIIALVMAGGMTPTIAQTIRATLTGTVIDPNGGVVQGAAVTATNIATNISTVAKTNQEGIYTFTALTPGEYIVEVGVTGFKRAVQSGVVLQIAQASRLDITLEVGAVSEEVRVVSEAPLVRSTSSELGQVIDYKQIQSLPLNGRLFEQLITLSPGALPRGFADFAENPAAAGARSCGAPQRERPALVREQLPARRRRQQRAAECFHQHHAASGGYPGVQGADQQPHGGVRGVWRRGGQPQHPLRHQSVPAARSSSTFRDDSLYARNFFAVTKAPFNSHQFGDDLRRPDHAGTAPSSSETIRACARTRGERSSRRFRQPTCGAVT